MENERDETPARLDIPFRGFKQCIRFHSSTTIDCHGFPTVLRETLGILGSLPRGSLSEKIKG